MKHLFSREVYIIDGARTPFLKARGVPGLFSASDLAVLTGKTLLLRQPFSAENLDEVIIGCMMPGAEEANIGRIIALRLGCGKKVPGWTVQRNCASGLQSVDSAAQLIGEGRADLILAGGTEAMSRAPSASVLLKGLTDHTIGLNMGQTAEILAYQFHITRHEMDIFALQSHQRLAHAFDEKRMMEITPLYDHTGKYYETDDGLRRDTTLEKLSSLKPLFDKPYGSVTAGNSSQITDGSALVILASQKAVKKYHLPVLGKIIDVAWAGLSPRQMGLGPVHAIAPILQRQSLSLEDIDYIEINEAFAAQVLACLKAFQDEKYCREALGLEKAIGELDTNKLNCDGGAIAAGHPIGASGTRVLLHTLQVLKREKKKLGLASLCIGGGLGGAMLLENIHA